jgi:hypothetical protein
MLHARIARLALRLTLAFALLAVMATASGCTKPDSGGSSGGKASDQPAPKPSPPDEPKQYTSWVVTIVDDDSYTKDGITYSIAMNLSATNPSADIAGKYAGEVTAQTTSSGTYRGKPLNASATAKSSQLAFTLEKGGGDLAGLTTDTVTYGGTGTLTMAAAGSGTYGQAGGSFGNSSSQRFTMTVVGEGVTMSIPIEGHTYEFSGTITGR